MGEVGARLWEEASGRRVKRSPGEKNEKIVILFYLFIYLFIYLFYFIYFFFADKLRVKEKGIK